MPAFAVLAPLIGSALKAGQENTNRRDQFNSSNISNAFSVFTGAGRQGLSGFLNNNSVGTVLKGVGGAVNNAQQLDLQQASDASRAQQLERAIAAQLNQRAGGREIAQNTIGAAERGFQQLPLQPVQAPLPVSVESVLPQVGQQVFGVA